MKSYHPSTQKVNIREGVVLVLDTVARCEQQHNASAICHHLKGRLNLTNGAAAVSATFGTLVHCHPGRIMNLVNYLVNHEFLSSGILVSENLEITTKGINFLQAPFDLVVSTQELRLSRYDYRLRSGLIQLRRFANETTGLPLFRIFTDYTIQGIVQTRPKTLGELAAIPGMGPFKVAEYGEKIVDMVKANAPPEVEKIPPPH